METYSINKPDRSKVTTKPSRVRHLTIYTFKILRFKHLAVFFFFCCVSHKNIINETQLIQVLITLMQEGLYCSLHVLCLYIFLFSSIHSGHPGTEMVRK